MLGKNSVGTMSEIYIYDDFNENEMCEFNERGYKFAPMILQELFAAMTEKK